MSNDKIMSMDEINYIRNSTVARDMVEAARREVGEELSFTYDMCIRIGDYREFADEVKVMFEALKEGRMPDEKHNS